MGNVVPIRPGPPVHRLKWKFLEHLFTVRGVEIHIIASDEPPHPEYIVLLWNVYERWQEAARLPQSEHDAMATIRKRADEIHTVLLVLESTWFDDDEHPTPTGSGFSA